MLVLTRRPGESIHIGTDIVVTVLEVKGHRIRIGIDAPKAVPVARGELLCLVASPPGTSEEQCEVS